MKFSQEMQAILHDYQEKPLPLGSLLERTGEQGFGLLTGLLTLPFMLPVTPPGLSTLLGLGVVLMGCQIALGFPQPWLPKRIARMELSPKLSQSLLTNLSRVLRPLEKITRPRWERISLAPFPRQASGACIAWCALLMALPIPPIIPFTNILPAITILVMAVALIELDGLLIVVGYGLTAATTLYFATIASVIWALILEIWKRVPGLGGG